ncbi:methyltransferase domain-containing protein [Janibacter limosus]|uniref:Protein-L-isoaspartate O-methyltransferase n=2 Tax=Janibacter limosus TaxID=53458 RepID=A0A4P6N0C5_9MICO|nr:methyltransferase domain-containing protein [Janibacter limosus]QBF48005.1 methyltransferase domain-containing protein [Janibacter limosus]
MRACPRTRFLPLELRSEAGEDAPVPIGHEQTNSQPSTVAAMLRLLDVRPGHRVLDVGSGSGWTSAVLGELVGPAGRVIGVERVPELVDRSRRALAEAPRPWVEVRQAQGDVLGMPELAPFDRILVSAAPTALPQALVDQLIEGGVMVIPVTGEMLRVTRGPDGAQTTRHGPYSFVPLVEG